MHKFANSFCTPAFALYDFEQRKEELCVEDDLGNSASTSKHEIDEKVWRKESSIVLSAGEFIKYWHHYALTLGQSLCSFIVALEDTKCDSVEGSTCRHNLPVSSLFSEISVRWILRVLLIVFPCIKAYSNQGDLPTYLRLLLNQLCFLLFLEWRCCH